NEDLTNMGKNDTQSSSQVSEEEEGDYETVSSSTLEAIHALKILPAKPLQESEYADKRCLRPSGTTSPMNSQHASQPPQYSAASEDTAKAVSATSSRAEDKQPVLSHEESAQPNSHLSNISKSHKVNTYEKKIAQIIHSTSHKANTVLAMGSLLKIKYLRIAIKNAMWTQMPKSGAKKLKGSMLNLANLSVKKSPSPTQYTACKTTSKHSLVKQEMQFPTQPTEKDLNKYEWYIGEYGRHEAEKALLQENTDETFLVRDCSKKSKTEPYVLVVYYGRRVYNIKVRFLEDSQQYALGTGLRGDDKFNSVKEIIDFYKCVPITLIDGKDKSGTQREQCYLRYPFQLRKRCFLP
ncbi:PREDICTED: cytokine-dependent hematopoietic cell linker, partial [Nestor notabilis]|uniref:cytokine-dependent hematopoietic cell linker n=1 Tax=Nestor notabilis TaxID=176057 RepID=UPI0005234043